ncbi:lipase [Gordonia alkaliphila]|uniref:alpha/beta hydrolase family protein n=1 Tax=Gordonia alkaliphila TaxID=1053547 RepID=UPI001FF17E91|nr:alpha/beta hydrolase [Gordonia alkaliphila]MCK0438077.1 lipase [Gordonia alkaliphila]
MRTTPVVSGPRNGRPRGAVLLAAVLVAVLSACAGEAAEDEAPPAETTHYEGAGPGSLVSSESFLQLDGSLRSDRYLSRRAWYRSTNSASQAPTEVSGSFFAPAGKPPNGGFPVIVIAPGTTGAMSGCGPSNFPDLRGYGAGVLRYLKLGYAVAVPDYQGLGPGDPGKHPYLEADTAGYNVIDAVRALRQLYPQASARWVATGGSAGGQATWAANELAARYAPELKLLGTASISPPVDLTSLGAGLESTKASARQRAYLPMLAISISSSHPDKAKLEDYLSPRAIDSLSVLAGCADPQGAAKDALLAALSADDLGPRTRESAIVLQDWLASTRLPQHKASAPMLIGWGGADPIVPPASVEKAVREACALGSTVSTIYAADAGHDMKGVDRQVQRWLRNRVDGDPAPDDCRAHEN